MKLTDFLVCSEVHSVLIFHDFLISFFFFGFDYIIILFNIEYS